MILKPYYLACLSHASYLVGDERTQTAVVAVPQRDVAQYLADARTLGLTIRHVFLTHFHADFVAGHLEFARATGATIHLGARAGGVRVHADERRRDARVRRSAARRARNARSHARGHLDPRLRSRARPRAAARRAHGRHAVDRRRRQARSHGVGRRQRAGARERAVRLAAREAVEARRRDARVSGARCGLGVRQEPLERDGLDEARALRAAAEARDDAIQVDAFEPDAYAKLRG